MPEPDLRDTISAYLDKNSLPPLPPEQWDHLERPLELVEVTDAIKGLKIGKSPGPDRFTARFYKLFSALVAPPLLDSFNSITDGASFPSQTLAAHVVVLPKPGKDPSSCCNYRPISLLNLDIKLYSKILALRLGPLLPSIIHTDQVGFVTGREARDNTLKSFSLIAAAKSRGIPMCLLSIDAEKAFDRVGWPFLNLALARLGMGPAFLEHIMALYRGATAQIRVNGSLSAPFNIHNGTRQGCPLSPLLYVIAMEYLAVALRQNDSIQGLTFHSSSYKLSLFADDLLLYVTSPLISLPVMLSEFDTYGALSHFKVNSHKSELLNVSLPPTEFHLVTSQYPFKAQPRTLKYLGIDLTSDLNALFEVNYLPLLNKLERDLSSWGALSLSWFGRLAAIKMDALPRLLYYMQTLPVRIPASFFSRLRSLVTRFVWTPGRPRTGHRILVRSREKGGVGLPDFRLYYQAVACSRILDLCHHAATKQWVALEVRLSSAHPAALPWLPPGSRPSSSDLPFLSRILLPLWDSLLISTDLSSRPGPLTPLFSNPALPPDSDMLALLGCPPDSGPRLRSAVRDNALTPLSSYPSAPLGGWFTYERLRSYYLSLHPKTQVHRPLTVFEQLCTLPAPPTHTISLVYGVLRGMLETPSKPAYLLKWEVDLGREFTEAEVSKMFVLTHKASLSSKIQERNFKILSRWYRCPDRIHAIFPSASATCWRCGRSVGTYLHTWWDCPLLLPFWEAVYSLYNGVSSCSVSPSPDAALLSILPGSLSAAKKGLLRHFLGAARAVIPRHWKSTETPSRAEYVETLNRVRRMEEMVSLDRDQSDRFHALWGPWDSFRETRPFLEWLRGI